MSVLWPHRIRFYAAFFLSKIGVNKMPTKSAIAKQGRNERRRLQRRIDKLQSELDSGKEMTDIAQKKLQDSIEELKQAQEATKLVTTIEGKVLRKTEEQVKTAISEAQVINRRYSVYLDTERKSFLATQSELNKASAGLESIYTKEQAQIFYKMTQKAWQREKVDPKHRNEAILEYYGRTSLAAFVDEVTEMNKKRLEWQKNNPEEDMTDEDKKRNDEEQQHDQEDVQKGYSENLAGAIAFESVMDLIGTPERL